MLQAIVEWINSLFGVEYRLVKDDSGIYTYYSIEKRDWLFGWLYESGSLTSDRDKAELMLERLRRTGTCREIIA